MTFELLGHAFKPLDAQARADIEPTLRAFPQPLSGYTMATLAAWSDVYHYGYGYTRWDKETLLISCHFGDPARRQILLPLGPFSVEAQQRLVEEAKKLPWALKIFGVNKTFIDRHPEFVHHFRVIEDRNSANYIYSANDLATLPGRQYHKKRNLLAGAAREYTWTKEELTPANGAECLQMTEDIVREDGLEVTGTLAHEMTALRATLRHLDTIPQNGILLRVDGKLVAFSVWEELMPKQAVQHFEKGRRGYKGIFQVINKETATQIAERGYELINREEDLGNEGLRQAKMTYFPVEIRMAHVLELVRDDLPPSDDPH